MEVLQKRKLKHNKRPQSQPHALENITIALDAIQDDGIKLVNIGKNLKLHYILHSLNEKNILTLQQNNFISSDRCWNDMNIHPWSSLIPGFNKIHVEYKVLASQSVYSPYNLIKLLPAYSAESRQKKQLMSAG